MKALKRIVLINWHYFTFETLELDTINFLTGKNGAGKTTVIDAIQLLMLGDTTGHFFNKSASDKSSRTLKGYLRCEIGDDDNGDMIYLRKGRFTSYVAGEFYDDVNNEYTTLGVVFDSYEDGSMDYKYFSYEGPFPENKFVENKLPLSLKELKIYLLDHYYKNQISFFETNSAYREFLKEKFGHLSNSFFGLFKKAIPFSPISNIETFITEYVCDVNSTIDIASMQENIRNYKKLESDSATLSSRVESLREIQDAYVAWKNQEDSILSQKYVYNRSDLQIKNKKLSEAKEKLTEGKDDLGQYSLLISKCEQEIKNHITNKEKLLQEKYSLDIYQKQAAIEEEKEKIDIKIRELQNSVEEIVTNMDNYQLQWMGTINKILTAEPIIDSINELKSLAQEYYKRIESFNTNIDLENLDLSYFSDMQENINKLKAEINGVLHALKLSIRDNEKRKAEISANLSNIDRGVKNYDARLLTLKSIIEHRLKEKYHQDIQVHILADLIEVKNPEWKNAIEGYLAAQKFYLFVDPAYFETALKIYDDIKFEYNLFDFGLVDCEKVKQSNPVSIKGSLAEEITTTNEYARAYINSLIGALIKCERVEELRNYPRSITKTGMLYQGYVARQINKEKWRNHYIGVNSLSNERGLLEEELTDIEFRNAQVYKSIILLEDASKVEVLNTNELKSMSEISKVYKQMPTLIAKKEEYDAELSKLDLEYVDVLDARIDKMQTKISEFEAQKEELLTSQVRQRSELERLEQFDIPLYEEEVKGAKEVIYNNFEKSWIMSVGEPYFMEELDRVKNITNLLNQYKVKVDHIDNQNKGLRDKLIMLRTQYNSLYRISYNPNANTNELYDDELKEFSGNKLIDYQEKIAIAKTNAISQFKDDFLSKLKANFDTVRMQIDGLNDALKDSKFGTDSYHFIMNPRSEYKQYYEMITDPLLMEGYSVNEDAFQEKYKDAIDDLFRQITYAEDSDLNVKTEIERNIAKYTDYRTYLKFDLIVTDGEGRKQHLSKTLLKKSGGETQTPFYISVLASFAQLYRTSDTSNTKNQTVRLIVFDEAFSKMDSERIQESVKLLRNYGLQAILSAPPEKMSDIVPLVDNTICIVRDDQKSYIRNYGSEKNKVVIA